MMAEKYTSELLGIVIAQIAQTIGYSRTQSAPLELLEDILQRFIQEIARDIHSQAEHANRVEPNLKDALLSLRNLNINVHELLDYIGNVEPIPCVRDVPQYPVKRSSNMNFLKPGSAETLTRPVHIFEYLPPMLPTESTVVSSSSRWLDKPEHEQIHLAKLESGQESAQTFSHKTAAQLMQEVKPDFTATSIPKWSNHNQSPVSLNSSARDNLDHEGHTIREISSVVMTTGGFISPAIEGKLPEAFVPDIIDKFKGLDAPRMSPARKTPEGQKHFPHDAVDIAMTKRMGPLDSTPRTVEQGPDNEPTAPEVNEVNNAMEASAASVPALPTAKLKKPKKKSLVSGRLNDQTEDQNAIKAKEKAQRKALKIYQKLSKNQVEGGSNIMGLKKTMKNLNRGMLMALPDGSTERMQLEKLIKKQTKQRQKHLKSQKQQRQFQSVSKLGGVALNPIPIGSVARNDPDPSLVPLAHPLAAKLADNDIGFVGSTQIDGENIFQSNLAISAKDVPSTMVESNVLPDETKVASEPDRNKLNIFKKISKQKTPKSISPNTLSIGTNLFETTSNVSPLITLPSGTTITPAPALNVTENINMLPHNLNLSNNMTYDCVQTFGHLPAVSPTTGNLITIDVNKPKKRGRKPGGKNQIKPPTSTSFTPISIQSPKKIKSTKSNSVLTYADPSINTLPLPIEPLNLSHGDQLKGTPQMSGNVTYLSDNRVGCTGDASSAISDATNKNLKIQKAKEKKERKKGKAKYIHHERDDNMHVASIVDNARVLNKNLGLMNTDMQIMTKSTPVQTNKHPVNETAGNSERNLQNSLTNLPGGNTNIMINASPPLVGDHGLLASSGPSNLLHATSLHPSNQPNLMPIMPLLHFPPRPGLIPSGPGLFPPSLTGFSKTVACNSGPKMIMPHSFMPFSSTGRSSAIVHRPSLLETSENKSTVLGLLPLTETHLDRSYCNVAPLVPESMKLPTAQIDTNKLKSPDRYMMFDAKQSNECSVKDISHISPISNIMPVVPGVGLSSMEEMQANQTARSTKIFKSAAAATGNLGDPIEVSDDSNDDESKAATKNNQTGGISHLHSLKSNLVQPSQLVNLGQHKHHESFHLYSMNANPLHSPISDGKQLNKQSKPASLKMTQPETNLLSAAPSTNPSPFNINFMGNDKFSLAGGADLIPLSRGDSGLAYSSVTVPTTSLAAGATSGSVPSHAGTEANDQHFVGSVNYDDITITPTNSLSISELKLRKLHKKVKKPKDGKIKKKKDKKDKIKNKEKSYQKGSLSIDIPKSQEKKQKKEKKKEKLMAPDELATSKESVECNLVQTKNILSNAVGDTLTPTVTQAAVTQAAVPDHLVSPKLDLSPNQVPKLTLKLSGRGTPTHSSNVGDHELPITDMTAVTPTQPKREHSPELARFSPLVTRPPKPKQSEMPTLNLSTATSASIPVPTSKIQAMPMLMPTSNIQATPSSGWISNASTATISASSVLLPQQLLHPSKQISKMSSSLSTTSAGVASVSPKKSEGPQSLPQSAELNRPSSYVDADGYRIWICPACGKVDDGSAMIGCDGCDAWYHWSCVGILVAPNDNEDWFCRVCITKKKGSNGSEKRKKRNKKK